MLGRVRRQKQEVKVVESTLVHRQEQTRVGMKPSLLRSRGFIRLPEAVRARNAFRAFRGPERVRNIPDAKT